MREGAHPCYERKRLRSYLIILPVMRDKVNRFSNIFSASAGFFAKRTRAAKNARVSHKKHLILEFLSAQTAFI